MSASAMASGMAWQGLSDGERAWKFRSLQRYLVKDLSLGSSQRFTGAEWSVELIVLKLCQFLKPTVRASLMMPSDRSFIPWEPATRCLTRSATIPCDPGRTFPLHTSRCFTDVLLV